MLKPIVKVDVDSVLRDITTPMCEIYNKEFGTNIKASELPFYDVDQSFPLIKEKLGIKAFDYFFVIHGDEVFYSMAKPIEGAVEAMKMLRDKGYRIVVVTNQTTPRNKVNAINFLEDNGIVYDDILFTNKKFILEGEMLIDDNPRFLKNEKGRKVLIDAPYNQWYHCNERYNSIYEFVKTL